MNTIAINKAIFGCKRQFTKNRTTKARYMRTEWVVEMNDGPNLFSFTIVILSFLGPFFGVQIRVPDSIFSSSKESLTVPTVSQDVKELRTSIVKIPPTRANAFKV